MNLLSLLRAGVGLLLAGGLGSLFFARRPAVADPLLRLLLVGGLGALTDPCSSSRSLGTCSTSC